MEDELPLLAAMREDEVSLKDRLGSVKLDDPTEKRLAEALLKLKMRSEEEDHLSMSRLQPESSGAVEDLSESSLGTDNSSGFLLAPSSPDLLYLDPVELELNGTLLDKGAYAKVRRTNLMGGKYALKILGTPSTKAFDQEMDALQRLGHHPHIVCLLGYSKGNQECCLIMEELDEDLQKAFRDISRYRRKRHSSTRPLSDMEAVSLMLQIGEGVKYIHSKGMAHRDIKSGNVLVKLANLADPSSKRISSVKIADFGLTKTKNASQTYSNQTLNQGTAKWMAPEMMQGEDDPKKYRRFNPRKADVYSFAIICFEILTGEAPYADVPSAILMKQQVKAGTLRPTLPEDRPPKLAALIQRCWHPISHGRPLFPEICREVRYIEGLLLRGDRGRLEVQDITPFRALERAQIQGPWGGVSGPTKFSDLGTSIKRMKLKYDQSPGLLNLMEVEYNLDDRNFVRRYGDGDSWGHLHAEIKFEPFESITRISGFMSKMDVLILGKETTIGIVALVTIHSNVKSYGPFGNEEGEPFESAIGRVIGFHESCGTLLDNLGVVIQVDPSEENLTK